MSFYRQYLKVKAENADAIVLFRVGDFYEMYGEDATTVSRELELTLTTRDCGEHGRVPINTRLGTEQPQDGLGEVEDLRDFEAVKIPMCGVPKHSVESYIKKLIEKGYKTAVCEPTAESVEQEKAQTKESIQVVAENKAHTVLNEYLEQNASDELKEKIKNGVRVEKDGKALISKKTIDTFLKYACDEAKKTAASGQNYACVDHLTVFNWLMHYFEEDSIAGILYNEDGTEYKPAVKTKDKKPTTATKNTTAKSKSIQPSFFDLVGIKSSGQPLSLEEVFSSEPTGNTEMKLTHSESIENEPCVDEDNNEINEVDESEADEITDEDEVEIPSGLRKIDDDHWVDDDGVVYESTDAANSEPSIPDAFVKLFGNKLIAR